MDGARQDPLEVARVRMPAQQVQASQIAIPRDAKARITNAQLYGFTIPELHTCRLIEHRVPNQDVLVNLAARR